MQIEQLRLEINHNSKKSNNPSNDEEKHSCSHEEIHQSKMECENAELKK